jgi:hypothetical protein
MKLYAPNEYWNATEEELKENCNGCGDETTKNIVPDKILGLDIHPACWKHDWMYAKGVTKGDKLFADAMFLVNMVVLILSRSSKALVFPRIVMAIGYFLAVARFGKTAFFMGKPINTSTEITFSGEFRDIED